MTTPATDRPFRPRLWVSGDWNAFFGFGTNILVNLLTLTALLRFGVGFPDELVFGRVLPAVGLMLFLSSSYYAWLAYSLARRTGRLDVCALPSGPGVGHMFIVVFAVMLPIKLQTGDPIKAWEAGLTWVAVQSLVLILGGFLGPFVRRVTPRAALLGTLAGVSITFISMRPALEMFLTPVIGLTCFGILLVNWFGGVRYFRGLPAGLVALLAGTAIAWTSTFFDLDYGGLSVAGVTESITHFGFSFPIPALDHVFSGFSFIGLLLVTAIPFGLYDLIEALDNVESASVAGDSFPTTRVLCADGVISMIGCLVGCPFMLAVYIGHPGWKKMGGRVGYSLGTGFMVLVLCWLGIVPLMLALVPVVSILPILLYIGMLIGSQAFQETPSRHAPAILLAMVPNLAAWVLNQLNGVLAAANVAKSPELITAMAGQGVLLHGLEVLGGGAALTGIVLGAITVYVIERKLMAAAAFAAAGAVFTFFGLMHGERIGFAASPVLATGYLAIAGVFAGCARLATVTARSPLADEHEAHHRETAVPALRASHAAQS
jgi:AGZA family xanthine/uracil permease-like MFS transporter